MRAEEQREKRGKHLTNQNSVASSNIHLIAGVSGIVYNVSPAFTKLTQHTIASLSKSGGLESIFENPNTFTEIIDTVQTNKDWSGHTIFLDENHDEYIAFIEAKPHKNSKQETELKLTFSDISKSKKNELIETRLLKAISVCTEALFSNTNSDVVAPPVLATIGKAMGIDRCYISKIVVEQGELYVERKYAWCKKPSLDNDYFASYSKFTYSSFFEVLDTLNAGKIVAITRRSKTGKEIMDILKKIDILSFLKIPIFKDNNLWGYIGFEDTENEREWSSAEKKALKSLAQNIGAHIKINSLTEELLNKNTQLENAIKGSSDGLWSVDNKADSFYISPQLYQIFGYTETTFPKSIEAIKQLLKTEETELLELEVIDAIKKQKANFEFETIAKHKTGKYIWLRGNLSLTYDEHGNVTKNSGSVADITTEKTFELRIRRQEEHYQRLVNGLKEVVFETDKEGKITFLNNSWKTLIGKTIKASTGKKLASFINKNHVDVFEEAIEQIRNKQSWPGRLELQIIKDKNPYWVELWMRGMYDSDYELTGISGSIFDINSKKIATEKLRESEERYRLISENTKDIVCLHDKDSNYVYISPSMYDTLGYPTRALLGQPAWTCIHPKDIKLLKQTFKQLVSGKQPGFIRYRVKHRKGHYVWVETIANIQQQPQDSETQLLIQTSTRDINHQKKAEEEIIKALEKERHLVELRTNLINMISHEFRTPLTSIKSSSDLVLKYLPTLKKSNTKERLNTHFERIRVQVNRINELISGVLLLGGIDTDKVKFSPESLDLKTFIDTFFVEYYETHTDDDRKVEVAFEGKQRGVEVDKLLLTHILRNLISNALKYSKGSKNPELNIKFERKNVVFIIKDYGIGIAEKDIQNLFQSFYRGDNALTIPGTGLGLVIVKQFIDMHNGDITLESRLNKGTIIQVTLPI
jgi:PAS domain S-box-containing protein